MTCVGPVGDYFCKGWTARRIAILERDGHRCRGCDRASSETDLQVHHRRYGGHGPCGSCVLTGISDVDLIALCVKCHDAITDVRRELRYAAQKPIEVMAVPLAAPAPAVAISKHILAVALVALPPSQPTVIRQRSIDRLGKE